MELFVLSNVPNIAVKVVSTDNPPTGGGEDGLPVLAGAVGNAIAALTAVCACTIAVRAGARARRDGGLRRSIWAWRMTMRPAPPTCSSP
jgi:hypothetical protein